jgi:hypothetical protein
VWIVTTPATSVGRFLCGLLAVTPFLFFFERKRLLLLFQNYNDYYLKLEAGGASCWSCWTSAGPDPANAKPTETGARALRCIYRDRATLFRDRLLLPPSLSAAGSKNFHRVAK